jgi:hypothetical protein
LLTSHQRPDAAGVSQISQQLVNISHQILVGACRRLSALGVKVMAIKYGQLEHSAESREN